MPYLSNTFVLVAPKKAMVYWLKTFLLKAVFALLLLILWKQDGMAQAKIQFPDIIVTKGGDTIRCSVRTIQPEFVAYQRPDSLKGSASGHIPKADIQYFAKKHFRTQFVSPVGWMTVNERNKVRRGRELVQFRLGAGPGRMAVPIKEGLTSNYKEHNERLRSGFMASLDATRFLKRRFGIGLRGQYFTSSNAFTEIVQYTERMTAAIISPQATFRVSILKSDLLFLYASPGIGVGVSRRRVTPSQKAASRFYQDDRGMILLIPNAAAGIMGALTNRFGVFAQLTGSMSVTKAEPLTYRSMPTSAFNNWGVTFGVTVSF